MGEIPFGLLPEGADVQAGSRGTLWLSEAMCWDVSWLGCAGPGCVPTALGADIPPKCSWGRSPAGPGGRCTAGLGCSPVSIDGGKSVPCSAFKGGLRINIEMPTDLQWDKKNPKRFVTLSTLTWNNSSEPGADFKHKEVPGWWRWRCTPWKGQAAAETSMCSHFWQKRGGGKGSSRASPRRKRGLCQSKERKHFYSWKCWKAPAVRRSRWTSALLLNLHMLFQTSQISPVSGCFLQVSVISCLV